MPVPPTMPLSMLTDSSSSPTTNVPALLLLLLLLLGVVTEGDVQNTAATSRNDATTATLAKQKGRLPSKEDLLWCWLDRGRVIMMLLRGEEDETRVMRAPRNSIAGSRQK